MWSFAGPQRFGRAETHRSSAKAIPTEFLNGRISLERKGLGCWPYLRGTEPPGAGAFACPCPIFLDAPTAGRFGPWQGHPARSRRFPAFPPAFFPSLFPKKTSLHPACQAVTAPGGDATLRSPGGALSMLCRTQQTGGFKMLKMCPFAKGKNDSRAWMKDHLPIGGMQKAPEV